MQVLESLDFVLENPVRPVPRDAKQETSYIVNRTEIHSVFHGIALKLSVEVYHNLAVCVVDGNRLRVPGRRLARLAQSPLCGSNTLRPYLRLLFQQYDAKIRPSWKVIQGKMGEAGGKPLRGKNCCGFWDAKLNNRGQTS